MELDYEAENLPTKPTICSKKAQRKKRSTNLGKVPNRFSLSGIIDYIGWDESVIMAYDDIAREDHSNNATREERSLNEIEETRIKRRGCTRTTGSER